MPTELLTPIISNGTTWGTEYYFSWLPFYNFVPVILALGILTMILTRKVFWGAIIWTSSVFALIPTWGIWRIFDSEPFAVFGWWIINTAFIIVCQWRGAIALKEHYKNAD